MNPTRVQSVQGRRELRQLQRRRRGNKTILFFAVAVLLGVVVVEMGRSYIRMGRVKEFIANLEVSSPEQVKADLDQFTVGLRDHNPLVRNASVAAFKVATAWPVQGDATEWLVAWRLHRDAWRYRPGVSNEPLPETVSPQPYRQAFPAE